MATFSFKKPTKENTKKKTEMANHKASGHRDSTHTQITEATAALNESLRTYTDDSSLSNKDGMRQVLDECQEQLSALTCMVEKIKVGAQMTPKMSSNTRKRLPDKPKRRSSKYDTESSQGSSNQQEQQQKQPLHRASINSKQALQRHSIVSSRSRRSRVKQSIRRDSIHSCLSFSRSGLEDGEEGMSEISKSLHSISHSIKSLPREIELMNESNDDDNDNCSFFDDSVRYNQDDRSVRSPSVYSQSVESRSAYSQSSRRSKRSLNRRSIKPSEDEFSYISHSTESSCTSETSRRSRNRRRGVNVSRTTSFNASNDTIQVENQEILDPYGEEGVYSGALSKSTGMPNGRGLLEYHKNGRWCEGDWVHGRLTGYGRLSNGSGDNYEGYLKNDHFHGYGVMQFDNGRVFEGTYFKGQMVQGKMTYQDGSIYDGSWVDCARHGRGRCIFGDGSIYEGEFKAGHFHGNGQMTWNDGGYYRGDWCQGQMHGMGKEVRPNGTVRHDGEWSHDQPVRHKKDKK